MARLVHGIAQTHSRSRSTRAAVCGVVSRMALSHAAYGTSSGSFACWK